MKREAAMVMMVGGGSVCWAGGEIGWNVWGWMLGFGYSGVGGVSWGVKWGQLGRLLMFLIDGS